MPTFTDESGDTGHEPNSAGHFHLAAVWVPTHEAATDFREAIKRLRRELRLPEGYEFRFSRMGSRAERREAFFQSAMHHQFRFAAVSVDKRLGEWRTANRSKIHRACVCALAQTLRPIYVAEENARVIIGVKRPLSDLVVVDDNNDNKFLSMVSKKFREMPSVYRPKASLVGKVRFRNSRPHELIQLADMVCGAVGAHLVGESAYYHLIAARDLGITRIP